MRHWRAAQASRQSGILSENEERDRAIEYETIPPSEDSRSFSKRELLLDYLPGNVLDGITEQQLNNLLKKSPNFAESSPRMFKLADAPRSNDLVLLPTSSNLRTQLALLLENSPHLRRPTQIRLFKQYVGFKLLASSERLQTAKNGTEPSDWPAHGILWHLVVAGTFEICTSTATGPEPVPTRLPENMGNLTDVDIEESSRLLAAISASELSTKLTVPETSEASRKVAKLAHDLLVGNLRLVAHEARNAPTAAFSISLTYFKSGQPD